MTTTRLATLASICLIIGGCATAFPNSQGSSSPRQAPVQQAGGTGPGSGQDVVQALSEMQGLQREIRDLRDRVERQEYELERLRTRQRDLYDDLDQRLRNQERAAASGGQAGGGSFSSAPSGSAPTIGQDSGQSSGNQDTTGFDTSGQASGQDSGINVATPTIGGDSGSAGQASGQQDAGQGQAGGGTASGQVAIVQPQMDGGGTSGGAVSASAQEAYDQAFGLLKQSRYADAVQAFEAFIRDYSSNDLTDDAYYWLAEARYVTREFEAALNGFRTVTTNFAESQRVPASYLKIGYIQYEIGAYTDARDTLTYIMKNFPTHRVAVSAETRLKKMDREGR